MTRAPIVLVCFQILDSAVTKVTPSCPDHLDSMCLLSPLHLLSTLC
jgi:hypothetical protein